MGDAAIHAPLYTANPAALVADFSFEHGLFDRKSSNPAIARKRDRWCSARGNQAFQIDTLGGLADRSVGIAGQLFANQIRPEKRLVGLFNRKGCEAADNRQQFAPVARGVKKPFRRQDDPVALFICHKGGKKLFGLD